MSILCAAVIRDETTVAGLVMYYVRATKYKGRPFSATCPVEDRWEAAREVAYEITEELRRLHGIPEFYLLRVESLSDAPRATPEAAAADMWRAVRLDLEEHKGARLQYGTLPPAVSLVGSDPLGDA